MNECVDRVLAGETLWTLTKWLNGQGVRTTRGNKWQSQVVRRMLLREMNIGIRVHQPLKNGKHFGPATRHKGQWDPIIDEDRFLRLKSLLTDPRRKTNNRGTDPLYLLTSVAQCGACGGTVVGAKARSYEVIGYRKKDGSRSPSKIRNYPASYRCPNIGCMKVQRGMADVDELVTGSLLGVLEREGVQIFGGDEDEAQAAREQAEALRARLDIAADQYADGVIESDQLARITSRLKPQIAEAEARFGAAQPSPAMATFTGETVRDAWAIASIETRKAVIAATGMVITILPIGPGNGATFDPASVKISWVR